MHLKSYKLLLLNTFLLLIRKSEEQVVECVYNYNYHLTYGYKTTNNTYYVCSLKTDHANYDEDIIKINGHHLNKYNNNDVQLLKKFYSVEKLKRFSSIFCEKFPNLEEISLEDVQLEIIDDNSLLNCPNLKRFFLGGNKIQEISENLFNRNTKLMKIKISHNGLTILPETLFQNQTELEELYLNDNQLTDLPDNIFKSLMNLLSLQLENNKLESINPEWLINLQNLKHLQLSLNKIIEIPSKCFETLQKLENLWLNENKIKSIKSDSFDGLDDLKILSLFGNEITELPANIFSSLKSLAILKLQYNKLKTIHSDSFGTHDNLMEISLENNKINAIDEKLLDKLENLSTIDMMDNICCQMLLTSWSAIKLKLKMCFDNYEPRIQPQMQIDFVFPLYRNLHLSSVQNTCGRSTVGVGNIVGGSYIVKGSFPWIAALVFPTGDYFCGGTLISSRKILTAAHCIQEKQERKPKSPNDFLVLLGTHDLQKCIEIGRIAYAVQKVMIHPDWNTLVVSFDADIAALVLEQEVIFSDFIQPICLLSSKLITITSGVVVGYGRSEDTTKVHENIPKAIETPIHTNEHCFLENSSLVKISSERTFCGGTGTGVGVCRGDSGSGLFVANGSAYYLRGIVSSSIIGGRYGCDVDTYSVFTDLTKYAEWIKAI